MTGKYGGKKPAAAEPPKDYDPSQSAWCETRTTHPRDIYLRSQGWRIVARPKDSEPVWQRGCVVRRQSQILDVPNAVVVYE